MAFVFGKKKRYSIGEKIKYFNSVLSDANASVNKRNWAQLRLNQILSIKDKMKLGDVFVTNDNLVGGVSSKPRLVVVAKTTAGIAKVIPVKKDGKLLGLSKFDGIRALHISKAVKVSKNRLTEKRGFKIAKNAYLTSSEKARLVKKVDEFL